MEIIVSSTLLIKKVGNCCNSSFHHLMSPMSRQYTDKGLIDVVGVQIGEELSWIFADMWSKDCLVPCSISPVVALVSHNPLRTDSGEQLFIKLGCTIILVVHGQVDPLSDTGQPLVEAHGHCMLVHCVGAP